LLIPVDDIAADSQIIHRVIVALEGVALLIASFTTWKHVSFEPRSRRLAQWVSLATGVFLFNGLLGGLYVISYDPFTNSFWELLSLLHLLIGSIAFLILATIWIASREDMTSVYDGTSS
jgi:heme A synthase